jgi:hypothetical protein
MADSARWLGTLLGARVIYWAYVEGVWPARRTQDYWPLRPLLFEPEFRYQSRVWEQFRESRCPRFFRPLLYQLSYLGESLILLGNSLANRTSARAMV